MKKIFYTQRVEIVESYQERRDCADQNIPLLIQESGYLPVPVPNVLRDIKCFLNEAMPDGIILTGGNSLCCYGGAAPERDKTDESLLRWATDQHVPVYGFCRGMQSVLNYFDVKLEQVSGHVAVRHSVKGEWGGISVNSYHNQAARQVNCEFTVAAVSEDGVIEAVRHREYPIIATMWHPERESPFLKEDIERIKMIFQ